jgi:hypothetical protein
MLALLLESALRGCRRQHFAMEEDHLANSV